MTYDSGILITGGSLDVRTTSTIFVHGKLAGMVYH